MSSLTTPEPEALAADLAVLKQLAHAMVAAAAVPPGAAIASSINTTGQVLHRPGGSSSYPAFWIRDAAMMLGGDLIAVADLAGWIRVIAATQVGPEGLRLEHGLHVPGYSIPDHINLNGKAVWYPGTYADGSDQGDGQFGFLPPADNAFYFVQMVSEHVRLSGSPRLLQTKVPTGWGDQTVMTVCDRAFASVAVDPDTGVVLCEAAEKQTRVDWGFCDSVRKTGRALFPSILRFRAARDLADLHEALGEAEAAAGYRETASRLRESIAPTFLQPWSNEGALLISATGLGHKFDVWGSAFAVAEGILDRKTEAAVCQGLLQLYREGGIVTAGQVRPMPPDGPLGGFWEQTSSAPGHYQNGGYWGTMSGWLILALRKVDPATATTILHDLVSSVTAQRAHGAPWEWINPALNLSRNPLYCATVALPYVTLCKAGFDDDGIRNGSWNLPGYKEAIPRTKSAPVLSGQLTNSVAKP